MTAPTLLHDRAGVAAPDVAVSITVVMLLAASILDLGNLVAARHSLDLGVGQAARYAAVNSATATLSSITAKFTAAVTPTLGAAGAAKCNVTVSFPGNKIGAVVTVSATYAWAPASLADKFASMTLSAQQALTIQH